jgi:hypothetical protein
METVGALRYNLLYSTNNLFGVGNIVPFLKIAPECADRYADCVVVTDGSTQNVVDIADEKTVLFAYDTPSGDVESAIRTALYTINTYQAKIITEDEANEMNKELNLFGLSMLPWNKKAIMNADGQYVCIQKWVDDGYRKMLNPLRREVLMDKVMTVAKIGIVGAGAYYGGKYAYKKLKL